MIKKYLSLAQALSLLFPLFKNFEMLWAYFISTIWFIIINSTLQKTNLQCSLTLLYLYFISNFSFSY